LLEVLNASIEVGTTLDAHVVLPDLAVALLDLLMYFKEQRQDVPRDPAPRKHEALEAAALKEFIDRGLGKTGLFAESSQNLEILIYGASKLSKRKIDVDRLIVVALLGTNRLSPAVCIERAGVAERRELEIEWEVLANSVNIICYERLVCAGKVVEVIYLYKDDFRF